MGELNAKKIAKSLGALEVGRLAGSGLHAVGTVAGLYLSINNDARSWILRTKVGSRRTDIGLGSYAAIMLSRPLLPDVERTSNRKTSPLI